MPTGKVVSNGQTIILTLRSSMHHLNKGVYDTQVV